MSHVSKLRSDLNASTAVEFAFLAPIFLVLAMGMAGYGTFLGASHSVQQIAADAARAAVAGLDTAERRSIADAYVTNNSGGYAFVDPNRLTVDVEDIGTDDRLVSVSVTYDASELPIWNLLRDLPLPGRQIVRRSVIRVGGA